MAGLGASQSPGVTLQEVNASQLTGGVATTIGAIVGAYKRGPIGPYYVTSGTTFTTNYGPLDTSWGFAGLSALAFLSNSNQLWFNRVVDSATCTYACADVFNGSNALGTNNYTYITPGTNLDLSYANASVGNDNQLIAYRFYLNSPFASGASVTINATIPDSAGTGTQAVTIGPIGFNTNSDTTMVNIANAISTAFNNAGLPTTATAINATNTNTCQTIQVLIDYTAANEQYVAFTSITVTGSPSTLVETNGKDIFQIFARDPGSYGNNVGVNITNANTAAPPQITLNIDLINSADSLSINGSISYNNHTATLSASGTNAALAAQNLINQVTNTWGGISGGIYSISAAASGTLSIILYAPAYGSTWIIGNIPFTSTDNTTSTGLVVTATEAANSTYNYFTLNVYLSGSTTPVESFTVSLANQNNGFGYQQFIEEVINVGSQFAPSNYIRVVYTAAGGSTNPTANVTPSFLSGSTTSNSSPIVFLGGGQDGIQPTDSEIITGWQQFASTDSYQIDLLINAGYTDTAVQQEMVSLAQSRQDCFAILDMPANVQTPSSAAANYVGTTLGINSSYAAIYTPNIQVLNTTNNQLIYAPPSGYIAGQYAQTDTNYAVWYNAAGYIRGVLSNVLGLYVTYDAGDRTLLSSYNINTIKASRNGSGNVVWDVLTLSTPMSLLSYVSIRRTFLYLEQSIINVLDSYVFDNITSQTEFLVTQAINNFLQPVLNKQGISNFYVLCNSINNQANTIDAGILNVTVYIVPVVPARVIALKAVVTPNSVSFQELISNNIF
ncbi:MAG: hypothetical protein KGH75_03870 [Rhodospirillales bacterium]|nr:hypothetical protein [Rhodospirillales bacterium]